MAEENLELALWIFFFQAPMIVEFLQSRPDEAITQGVESPRTYLVSTDEFEQQKIIEQGPCFRYDDLGECPVVVVFSQAARNTWCGM